MMVVPESLRGGCAFAACLVLLVAACSVGPDFRRSATQAGDRFTKDPLPDHTAGADAPGGAQQRWVVDQDIPAQWWQVFHSSALDGLIREAFRANPDVQSARCLPPATSSGPPARV